MKPQYYVKFIMIKEALTKVLGDSHTAITNAWNFHKDTVETSSVASMVITTVLACVSTTSRHFLGVSGTLLTMILLIITADFITGISYAYKQQRRLKKRLVCASKGIRSAYKLGVYIIFLFCTNTLVREYEGMWVSEVLKYIHIYITIHIFFWEAFSVDENMSKLGFNLGLKKFLQSTLAGIQYKFTNDAKKEES